MILRKIVIAAIICLLALGQISVWGQVQRAFTPDQYKKALWMATRFYGGQRSGHGPNWLIMEHNNPEYRTSFTNETDGGRDIVGGWFDCGDHIMYGQTFFFTAYVLALAYESFPEGFHDLYQGDYSDYAAGGGDWGMDKGKPNGIPDILEELKYATDWIIKATPDASTFIYQMGDNRSHNNWSTVGWQSANMQTGTNWNGGSPRPVYKNPNDKPMPSLAAAALAVMSRIYRKYDPDYADKCLEHAIYAYSYAAGRSGSVGSTDGNYQSHKDPNTVFVTAAAEMYLTTGENVYLNAIAKNEVKTHWHTFDYINSHDLTAYAAARAAQKAGNTTDRADYLKLMLDEFVAKYTRSSSLGGGGQNAEPGIFNLGGDWGEMRYPANAAFIAALYSLATGTTDYDQFIYNQIDFALGKNASNQSFLVGFHESRIGSTATVKRVVRPHHRNVFMMDFPQWNEAGMRTMTIPLKNTYFGFLAGGRRNSAAFDDTNINDFKATEGGLDYQAGFVGALAYIVSKLAPADTSKFGEPPVTAIPTTLQISTSQDPSETAAYVNDTLRIAGGATIPNPPVTLYAHIFDQDGKLITSIICESVFWDNSHAPRLPVMPAPSLPSGCSHDVSNYDSTPTITVTYFFAGANRPSIQKSIVVTDNVVSVKHQSAMMAKYGFAVNIRRDAVIFNAGQSRAISEVSIYNIAGRKVFSQKRSAPSTQVKWSTASTSKGMYVARIKLSNGAVVQHNVLIK